MLNFEQWTKQTCSWHLWNLQNIFLRFTSIIEFMANQIMENTDFSYVSYHIINFTNLQKVSVYWA